jgi:hypothetical protein
VESDIVLRGVRKAVPTGHRRRRCLESTHARFTCFPSTPATSSVSVFAVTPLSAPVAASPLPVGLSVFHGTSTRGTNTLTRSFARADSEGRRRRCSAAFSKKAFTPPQNSTPPHPNSLHLFLFKGGA